MESPMHNKYNNESHNTKQTFLYLRSLITLEKKATSVFEYLGKKSLKISFDDEIALGLRKMQGVKN